MNLKTSAFAHGTHKHGVLMWERDIQLCLDYACHQGRSQLLLLALASNGAYVRAKSGFTVQVFVGV